MHTVRLCRMFGFLDASRESLEFFHPAAPCCTCRSAGPQRPGTTAPEERGTATPAASARGFLRTAAGAPTHGCTAAAPCGAHVPGMPATPSAGTYPLPDSGSSSRAEQDLGRSWQKSLKIETWENAEP